MKANGQPTDGYKMPKLSDISRSRGKGKNAVEKIGDIRLTTLR